MAADERQTDRHVERAGGGKRVRTGGQTGSIR